jgi:hypothetical protein
MWKKAPNSPRKVEVRIFDQWNTQGPEEAHFFMKKTNPALLVTI